MLDGWARIINRNQTGILAAELIELNNRTSANIGRCKAQNCGERTPLCRGVVCWADGDIGSVRP
jgi:hypothetical protein